MFGSSLLCVGKTNAMAQTKQDIILTDILDLKPVSEKNVHRLLNRIEELRYKCNQCGGAPLGDNAAKRILANCAPNDTMKPLTLHLEGTTTSAHVRKLTMGQTHDELTGMFEGEQTQPLHNLENPEPNETEAEGERERR